MADLDHINFALTLELYKFYNDLVKKLFSFEDEEFKNEILSVEFVTKKDDDLPRSKLNFFDESVRCAYLLRFSVLHTVSTIDHFQNVQFGDRRLFDRFLTFKEIRVCCFGGGPGSDLIGICKAINDFLNENYEEKNPIFLRLYFTVIDICNDWENWIIAIIKKLRKCNELCNEDRLEVYLRFIQADLTKRWNEDVKKAIKKADIVTMVRFMSMLSISEEDYEKNKDLYMVSFNKKGFVILKNFLSETDLNELSYESNKIVQHMTVPSHCSVFSTENNDARDEYFINSGDNISFFFEKDVVDDKGNLLVDKDKALNKIGHALHWWNPVFKKVTFSKKIKALLRSFNYQDPVVVQSMVIFKHPEIGGEVTPHQDSTFLYTEPLSTIGIWIPLVDITLENGCLWFIPGSHKGSIYQRFIRNSKGKHLLKLEGDMPSFNDNAYVPILVNKGDCVVIHGSAIHKSGKNLSNSSRPIYTFHIVEQKETEYCKENWLQPSSKLPFPSVYAV